MGIKIYMFDNQTGRNIPKSVDTVDVELLIGSKISDIHNSIEKGSRLFCVFTPLNDVDIIVPSEYDAKILNDVLSFGKYNYKIEVKPSSIWYSNNADRNIIISDKVDLDENGISTMLRLYLDTVKKDKIASGEIHPIEMHSVFNIRSGKTLLKTPDYVEAKTICDKNPCCVIKNREGEIIYKSAYGRVSVPLTTKSASAALRNKIYPNGAESVDFGFR